MIWRFRSVKGIQSGAGRSEYRPKMECKEGTVFFDEALEIHHELVQNGIGKESVVHLPDLR